MSIKADDRIYETSTTTGTGTYTLAGAATGFQPFSSIGANNFCPYLATDGVNWEVGLGKYTASPDKLERTHVWSSSNGDAAVDWATGTRNLYCVFPASLMFRGITDRSSNTILAVQDVRRNFRITGSYTQTFDAVATLGDGWEVDIRIEAGVTLTLDPNSTETIDGSTTLAITGPWAGKVICNGSALYTACTGYPGMVEVTPVATTSGTSVDFTGLPASTRLIIVNVRGVSLDAATELICQIGDAGGIESSGYGGTSLSIGNGNSVSGDNPSGSWRTYSANNAAVYHGQIILARESRTGFAWTCAGHLRRSDTAVIDEFGGSKVLTADLDRVRITSGNGTANFDAGEIGLSYIG